MKDENATLQLELTQMEEKIHKLDEENKALVDRWLKKMSEDAEKLNEANDFVET